MQNTETTPTVQTPATATGGTVASTSSQILSTASPTGQETQQPEQSKPLSWLGEVDDLTLGYVQNKGWQDAKQMLESYRTLEQKFGADRAGNTVVVPKVGADPKEWDTVFDRLGRPSSPEGYAVEPPKYGDSAFQGKALSHMHSLGLTKSQGEGITNWYNQTTTAMVEAQQAAQQEAWQKDQEDLTAEWGAAYNQNLAAASSAARALALSPEKIDKMSASLGHKETMLLLQRIGSGLRESDFVSGQPSQGHAMTPQQALDSIRAFKEDKGKVAAYLKGDKAAVEEMSRLHQFAYPKTK